ncbi:hypothetical protein C8J57DRAFT_1721692 [Mycena rebaudengoi]|nr:hypothetical protein C8J57DRAFT_1721692 [Mycena rebaudengoi]
MTSADVVFHIQELCDQLVDHLASESYPSLCDLKSAALVCHTLCNSSRSHIYRYVSLDPWEEPDYYLHSDEKAGFECAASTLRALSSLLTTSPHLARFVRRVRAIGHTEILQALSELQLPLVRKLEISFYMTKMDHAWLLQTSHLIQDLIGRASVHEVELSSVGRLDRENFAALFDKCSPNLEALRINGCFFNSLVSSPRGIRTKLKTLHLICASDLEHWFDTPSCPFDLTGVLDLEVERLHEKDKDYRPLFRVLASTRFNMTRMRVSGDFAHKLDLSQFPALTCLEVHYSNFEAISNLANDNCVRLLILEAMDVDFHDGDFFGKTDTVVANHPMPALRKVQVLLLGPSNGGLVSLEVETVKSYFPKIEATGLLEVKDGRYYDPVL